MVFPLVADQVPYPAPLEVTRGEPKMHEFDRLTRESRKEAALGNYWEACQGYRKALQAANTPPQARAKVGIELADCLYRMGKFRYALRQTGKVENSACGPKERYRLLILEANLRLELGEYDKAKEIAQDVFRELLATSEHGLLADVEHCLGRLSLRTGDLRKAREYFEDSLSSFRLINEKKGMLKAINSLAQIAFMTAEWDEALKYLQKGLRICPLEWERERAAMMGNLGTLYRRMGKWREALNLLESSLELKLKIGETLPMVNGYISLGRLYLMQRRWEEAEKYLQKALGLCQGHSYTRQEAMSLESLGDLAKEKGDFERSSDYYQRTMEIARRLAPRGDLVNQVQRRRAELYLVAGGDLKEATRCAQEALGISRDLKDGFEEGCCYRVLALIAQAEEDRRATEANFRKAFEVFKSIGEKFELGKTILAKSKFGLLGPQKEEGRRKIIEQLKEARRTFQGMGAHYEEGLVEIELARAQMSGTNPDWALGPLESAERIFRRISEKDGLKEILALRAKMEERLAASSLLVREERAALDRLDHISPEDMELLLRFLSERIHAERGFVAFRPSANGELTLMSRYNLNSAKAEFLLSYMENLANRTINPGQPFICTSVVHNQVFATLRKEKVENFMVFPFGNKSIEGFLYVDRTQTGGKGAFDQKDLNFFVLAADILQLKAAELQKEELLRENLYLRERLEEKYGFGNIVTINPRMEEALRTAQSFKDSYLPILITGETGTGKELIARALHYSSQRRNKNFVPVNCAAFTDTLLESEFFGHKKGSFTNAIQDKKGLFEEAQGGTLFLDEVANASEWLQAKLLRVLEEMEIRRLGETRARKVDVCIISATNKDLEEAVEAGNFRKDLYYRLTGVEINLPPLRERVEDIPPLIYHFLELFTEKRGGKVKGVDKEAMELLTAYNWPGNVRQLKNEVERATILASGEHFITPEHLSPALRSQVFALDEGWSGSLPHQLAEFERENILRALQRSKWVKTKAATILKIPEATLRRKMRKYELEGRVPRRAF